MKILSPKLDIIFKRIFSDKDNSDILADFLSCILDIDVEDISDIQIENGELLPDFSDRKKSILDLRLTAGGIKINIEIQISAYKDYENRALFYWSRLYSKDLQEGDSYSNLMPTYSINILDFNMFDSDDYHSTFLLTEQKRGEVMTNHIRFDFLELRKVGNGKDMSRLSRWIKFLNIKSEEDAEMLETYNDKKLNKAVSVIKHLSADERIQMEALAREMAAHDEATIKETYYEQGMRQSEQRIIENMRKLGISEDVIQSVTKI